MENGTLEELVKRGVESEVLDYKSAMNWNLMSRSARAKIIRHCLAMANTKGGSVVIGVGEDASGHPSDYQGLSPEEVHSFDPSTVGAFINRYVEPPIDFTIERPEVDGKRYAIFMIRPFKHLPHVCSQNVENELQQGAFYIRTPDASSRIAYRAIEMQNIIQRALRNQREALGRMLRGILYETQTSADAAAGAGEFAAAMETARQFFNRRRKSRTSGLRAEFAVIPQNFEADRFTLTGVRNAVERVWNTGNTADDFLSATDIAEAYFTNVALRSMPEERQKMCQFFKSGLFHFLCTFPGKERKLNMENIVNFSARMLAFLGGYYTELGMADDLLTLQLTCSDAENWMLGDFRCHIPEIKVTFQRSAADLAAAPAEHALKLLTEFCERFNVSAEYLQQLPAQISRVLEE